MTRIEDYAFIGDTHHGALVSKSGSIDWMCVPRFDSTSVFAALLDEQDGGHWRISPKGDVVSVSRSYRGETMILETTFETSTGAVRLIDCLPLERRSDPAVARRVRPEEVVVRIVEGIRGRVAMEMDYSPRFDYGETIPWFRERHGGIEAVGGPDALDLVANADMEREQDRVTAEFEVAEGAGVSFICAYHLSHLDPPPRSPDECHGLIEITEEFWRRWVDRCSYRGRWRDPVIRSLLTLKALTYSPSGGVVAAATTSLPESLGGGRNWDYRYCWLRDATFTLDSFLRQGFTDEAREWRDWLLRAVAGRPDQMQIMYGVLGERRLTELELPWLSGYEDSKPVRIGNAAHDQFQLDIYGEVMDSFHDARGAGIDTTEVEWKLECSIVDFVSERWREPDEGIWEFRSGREHFVHSKVMAWVAIDRAIRAVEQYGKQGPVEQWRQTCEAIREEVMSKGVDHQRKRFKRSYDHDELDAALLMLPLVGFVEADDEIMANTIDGIQEELVEDGLVFRYRTEMVDDGVSGHEGSFLMCTFWLVDCLALGGRMEEAEAMYERLLAMCNDVGLLSEQYDPVTSRFVGNFPQAFSHVALITSAMALETEGEAARRAR